MAFIENVNTRQQATPDIDAFGRTRVSQVTTQGDIKQLYDNPSLFINTELNGSSTSTHTVGDSETELATSNPGDWVVAQTKQRFNYQSGKSQEIFMTVHGFGLETNILKRYGYYHSNTITPFNSNLDGFWIEADGINISFVTSKTGTETSRVNRSEWFDPMDGTGESGLDLGDLDGNLINQFDYEWLGLGQVRVVFVSGGSRILVHAVDFTNGSQRLTDSGWVTIDANFTGVYMSSPNQPLRWEVRQTGAGSGSMNYVCSAVGSEGSLNEIGKEGGADDNGTHLNANNTSVWYYAIGIRLKTTHLDAVIDILNTVLKSDTNDAFIYRILFNPTYDGTVTYNDVDDYAVQYGLGTTTNDITDMGSIMRSGYGDANTTIGLDIKSSLKLGSDIDGTRDEIVIAVKPHTSNLDIHRAINWRE